MALKSVTIRLDEELHETLSDYVRLTKTKMQDIVGDALEKELQARLAAGGESLLKTLESMRRYRKRDAA